MKEFNDDDINDLSIEDINELYKDVIEMPEPLIATVCGLPKVYAAEHR
ncbi:MAG: hypothetical protein IJY61_04895 [Candidatus Gastranaerophilales bacterium]|nr:hypothetical protein [Candidatus Gastranaerophilales bacterium]